MASDKFVRAHRVTSKWEGGYVNHPSDPGGATNFGVTQATYDAYRRRMGLPTQHVRNITQDEVHDIYVIGYWNKIRGDDLPAGVDLAVYDFAVNSGPHRAARYLQRVVGVGQDGKIGPKTIAASKTISPRRIVARLMDDRLTFLRGLPTWGTFGRGWGNRVADVRAKALAMTEAPKADDSLPLSLGSKGPNVRTLQAQLNANGADPMLIVDGDFGPLTERAVIDFQKTLMRYGTVGGLTWAALGGGDA